MPIILPADLIVEARVAFGRRLAVLAAAAALGLAACAALLAALGGPALPAWAAPAGATRPYPGSAPCDTTLQACLDGSAAGDTVVVQPGTYITDPLTLGQAVSLTGVSSATVILQGEPGQRLLSVTDGSVDSSVVISGLTFTGGHAVGVTCADGCGGAVYVTAGASPRLINLTFRNNTADQGGGALFADDGSQLALTGVQFISNTSTEDGGGAKLSSAATVNQSLFELNQCTATDCNGGGLLVFNGLLLTGTRFLTNTSGDNGGGVNVLGPATVTGGLFQSNQCLSDNCQAGGLNVQGALTASATQFLSNTSLGGAGALRAASDATLSGALLRGNQCTADVCLGGAAAVAGNLTLSATQFISNASLGDGGAANVGGDVHATGSVFQDNQCTESSCWGGGLIANADLALTGTQFLSNTSAGDGGGVYVSFDASVTGGLFQNNHCTDPICAGGGLAAEENLSMTGTRVLSNSSTSEGGGVFVFVSSFVTNTVLMNNQSLDGGGLYQCEGGGLGGYVNDLFAGNQASEDGNALYIGSPAGASLLFTTLVGPAVPGAAVYVANGAVTITDTLIASSTVGIDADADAGGSVLEGYNLFSGVAQPYSGTVLSAGHSLTGTAGFVNAAAGNFHLHFGSPAINAGAAAGVTTDIDGQPRPFGGGFDIGYDEYASWNVFFPLTRR